VEDVTIATRGINGDVSLRCESLWCERSRAGAGDRSHRPYPPTAGTIIQPRRRTVTILSGTPLGTYFLLACADDTKAVIEALPRIMRPVEILRIAALPRDTGVNKVQRRRLVDQPVLWRHSLV